MRCHHGVSLSYLVVKTCKNPWFPVPMSTPSKVGSRFLWPSSSALPRPGRPGRPWRPGVGVPAPPLGARLLRLRGTGRGAGSSHGAGGWGGTTSPLWRLVLNLGKWVVNGLNWRIITAIFWVDFGIIWDVGLSIPWRNWTLGYIGKLWGWRAGDEDWIYVRRRMRIWWWQLTMGFWPVVAGDWS